MRCRWSYWIAALLLAAPAVLPAANCITQAELAPQARGNLAAAGQGLAQAIVRQDFNALHAALLPALTSQWEGIRGAVEDGGALVKDGKVQLRNLYLLDATSNRTPSDTQFFCTSADGSLTVTVTLRDLPPGRYGLVLADAAGAKMAGQIGMMLVWDAGDSAPGWKLGGVSIRPGSIGGHDGVWYWQQARTLATTNASWSAWYSYELARYLLLPYDFISSPNLDKLNQEQSAIKGGPSGAFPMTVSNGERSWKVDSLILDTSLRADDLRVTYESIGIEDPAATRTEAVAVLSAMLKARPELRENFHGLWAYAVKNGKAAPVIEMPMAQIP